MFVTQTSFARGEVDERAQDRADADLLRTGAQRMENFVPRLAGGVQKRTPMCMPFYASIDETDRLIIDSAVLSFQYERVTVVITLWYYEWEPDGSLNIAMRAEAVNTDYLPGKQVLSDLFVDGIAVTTGDPSGIPFDQPDVPLHWYVNISNLGPTAFITSPYFAIRRVYISDSGSGDYVINQEQPSFFKELYSEAFAYDNQTLVLVDGAAASVLSSGDTVIFKGQEDTIGTIYGYEDTNPVDQWVYDDYPSARAIVMNGSPYSNLMVGRNAPLERPHQPLSDPFGGNPWLSTFHQGRLLVFSTFGDPTRMWASKPQNPFIIRGPAEDTDSPIEYDLAAPKAEGFTWVSGQDKVLLGTPTAEYVLDSLSDQPLSPGNFGFYKASEQGSSRVRPARADSGLFLSPRGRQAVSIFQYSDSVQGFQAQYLTSVVPALFEGGVERIAFEPPKGETGAARIYTIVKWGDERMVVACVFDQQAETIGWYRYYIPADISPRDFMEADGDMYLAYTRDHRPGVYFSCLSQPKDFSLDFAMQGTVETHTDSNGDGRQIVNLYDTDGPTVVDGLMVTMLGTDGEWYGEATAEWDDEFGSTWTYVDVTDQDWATNGMAVWVGSLFTARMDMFPPTPGAEAVNRPMRNIRSLFSVYETADLWANGISVLQGPPKSGQPVQAEVSGTYEVRTLGWDPRPVLKVESTWPYACTILSVTREVQV